VSWQELEASHPTAEQVIAQIITLAKASFSSSSNAALKDFQNVMQTLIASPRVGKPTSRPSSTTTASPFFVGSWGRYRGLFSTLTGPLLRLRGGHGISRS
jgi:hypothetical protein